MKKKQTEKKPKARKRVVKPLTPPMVDSSRPMSLKERREQSKINLK